VRPGLGSTDKWSGIQISVVFGFDNNVNYEDVDDLHVMIGVR
jgi:hypothetical protein